MKNDFEAIRKFEQNLQISYRNCVENEIRKFNVTYISNAEMIRFCEPYVFNRTSNHGDCSIRLGKMSNKCESLRRCCQPAARCEQSVMYSETGRTLTGMREEIDIKMAECTQYEEKVERKMNNGLEKPHQKKQKKIKIIDSPPFSLCLKYLKCQQDAHEMRVNCSKSTNPHSIDAIDAESSESDSLARCRNQFVGDHSKMNQKREEAFQYLDKCVPNVNVTREFMITSRVCRASTLKERPMRLHQNCHVQVAQKRKECSLLRDCCVQADVCERSALYAVISDEYLLRRTQLRQNFDECLMKSIENLNHVQ
ncbi:unnamed protein product [Caenorhabditis bovis]|uniref:Uncharacterized protein n=1 Tax=Caenorhabditis bovis TaxID=2654633 RepID=A0A8S1EXX6_9PELO|nr:unnamed protein product [Caenorhabditis bovis]